MSKIYPLSGLNQHSLTRVFRDMPRREGFNVPEFQRFTGASRRIGNLV
ncbi:MAG: hypothetical protein LBG87_07125 [Spirochaetaceae bacterium]|nr:hypothetical protein [Spirochaetaceae bacterium]